MRLILTYNYRTNGKANEGVYSKVAVITNNANETP